MFTITVRDRFTSFLRLAPPDKFDGYDIYHNYAIEVAVSGAAVDEQGYLLNIDDLSENLSDLVSDWDGSLLNDFDEFADVNPTLELVARIACEILAETLEDEGLNEIRVTVWESEIDPAPGPSASYRMDLE
ncbi:6-carboxytetrahydropterin synthase [bacterium]|nr:6-carboxytetrahydropterin synthase [bacterium]